MHDWVGRGVVWVVRVGAPAVDVCCVRGEWLTRGAFLAEAHSESLPVTDPQARDPGALESGQHKHATRKRKALSPASLDARYNKQKQSGSSTWLSQQSLGEQWKGLEARGPYFGQGGGTQAPSVHRFKMQPPIQAQQLHTVRHRNGYFGSLQALNGRRCFPTQ